MDSPCRFCIRCLTIMPCHGAVLVAGVQAPVGWSISDRGFGDGRGPGNRAPSFADCGNLKTSNVGISRAKRRQSAISESKWPNQPPFLTYHNIKSLESLQQHIRDAKAHKDAVVVISPVVVEPTTNNTPLDEFFLSFPSFAYGPSLPPAQSYSLLWRHVGWPRESVEGDQAWAGYREALVVEVRVWFGSENDLGAWHTLCRAIGIQQAPETIQGCVAVSSTLNIPKTWQSLNSGRPKHLC